MSNLLIQHSSNFSYITNVFDDDEIEILHQHWEKIPILHNNDKNYWDKLSEGKTKIVSSVRNVEIVGIPVNKFDFLSEKIEYIFSLFIDGEFGIESPHYFTKYPTGGYHKKHQDNRIVNNVIRSKVITIQISDENSYNGGELVINGEVAPKYKGCVIIYNSHDFHEVTTVTKGVRYSITECAGEKK